MKDKSYIIQDGCHNCKFVFREDEYDDGALLFCHQDKSKRPKCGSVYMGEVFSERHDEDGQHISHDEHMKVFSENSKKWQEWSRYRVVQDSGKCKFWECVVEDEDENKR